MKQFAFALFGTLLATNAAAATIRGLVLAEDGKPVANAQVTAYAVEANVDRLARVLAGRARPALAKSTTATDGAFALDVDGKGVVVIGAAANDFAAFFTRAVLGDTDVVLPLARPMAVERSVRPAVVARVIVLEQDGEFEGATDARGKCTLPDFPDSATLLVLADGFAPAIARDDVVLDRGVTLRGVVIGPDRRGVPLARIIVNSLPLATSAPDGTFTILHAPSQRYLIEADAGLFGGTTTGEATPLKIAVQRRVKIRGIVRDAEKHPLRGVAMVGDDRPFVSDANGAFEVNVPPAKYKLTAADEFLIDEIVDATKPVAQDLVATPVPRLAGIVRMEDGTPVAGARVSALFGGRTMSTMTDAAGKFRLRIAAAGSVSVVVTKEGLAPARSLPVSTTARDVVVTVGKGFDAKVRVIDLTQAPLAGVTVSAGTVRAVTGSDGIAALRLYTGKWDVKVAKDGYVARNLYAVEIGAAPLVVQLDASAPIRGTVVRSDGSGAAGVFVSANEDHSAMTAADGSFAIDDVTAGAYMLRVFSRDGIDFSRAIDAPSDHVRLVLPETAAVRGSVVDTSGAPVTPFRIAIGPLGGNIESHVVADPDGRFARSGIPSGPVRISVSAEGFSSVTKDITAPADDVRIVLARGRTLRGRVTSAANEPLDSAAVLVRPADEAATDAEGEAITQRDGSYELSGITNGAAIVIVRAMNFIDEKRALPAGSGDATLDVQLMNAITVTGHVVTSAGQPVANANVSAETAAANVEPMGATTAADGSFKIGGLAAARYDFEAVTDDARGRTADVDVTRITGVTIRMAPPTHAVISGRVIGAPKTSLPYVSASSANRDVTVNADSAGNYRIENAPIGVVDVIASVLADPPRTAKVTTDVAPDSETNVDIVIPPQFPITGRVTIGDQPLAGAGVTFTRAGIESSRAATRGDGSFETLVAAGAFSIRVEAPELPGGYDVEREISGPSTINLAIDAAQVTIRVVDAATGEPIAGANVSTRDNDAVTHFEPRGVTPASGEIVTTISSDVHEVIVAKSGYATATSGISGRSIRVALTPSDGVAVRIVDARDGRTLTGTAIARNDSGAVLASANETNIDGTMHLALAGGSYRFSVSAQGYGSQTVRATVPAAEVRIALPRAGSLLLQSHADVKATARLIDGSGEEYVRCWCNGIATIAIDGRATLVDQIAPGSYALEVTPAGGKPRRIPVTVIEGVTTPVSVEPW